MAAVAAGRKDEWLALFTPDAVVEDPVGPPVTPAHRIADLALTAGRPCPHRWDDLSRYVVMSVARGNQW